MMRLQGVQGVLWRGMGVLWGPFGGLWALLWLCCKGSVVWAMSGLWVVLWVIRFIDLIGGLLLCVCVWGASMSCAVEVLLKMVLVSHGDPWGSVGFLPSE